METKWTWNTKGVHKECIKRNVLMWLIVFSRSCRIHDKRTYWREKKCWMKILSKFFRLRFHLGRKVELGCYESELYCITSWVTSWSEIRNERTGTDLAGWESTFICCLCQNLYTDILLRGTVCICWTVQFSRSWASRVWATCSTYSS